MNAAVAVFGAVVQWIPFVPLAGAPGSCGGDPHVAGWHQRAAQRLAVGARLHRRTGAPSTLDTAMLTGGMLALAMVKLAAPSW